MPNLDAHDRRLLELIQVDAARTADELASVVPLSPSAIQRRLKRLHDEGVIEREVAVLDAARLGGATLFFASLRLRQEHPASTNRLQDWMAQRPEIQQAYYVTGDHDYIVVVCAADVASYEALMARLMQDNPDVARYTTSVVLKPVKRSLTIPLQPPGN